MVKLLLLFIFTLNLYSASNAASGWIVQKQKNPQTNEEMVTFAKYDSSKGSKKKLLAVKCSANSEPELIINWREYISNQAFAVTHNFDKQKPSTNAWIPTYDSMTTFYPKEYLDKNIHLTIIEKLVHYKQLTATIDNDGSEIKMTFDLKGFSKASANYRKLCQIRSNKEIKQVIKRAKQRLIDSKNPKLKERLKQECIKKTGSWRYGDNNEIICGQATP